MKKFLINLLYRFKLWNYANQLSDFHKLYYKLKDSPSDKGYMRGFIVQEFKHYQIDSLMLDTKIIKYQSKKKGGAMFGKFMRILEHTTTNNVSCVTSELINCKSKKQISLNTHQSIIN